MVISGCDVALSLNINWVKAGFQTGIPALFRFIDNINANHYYFKR
jgi:hypothetical protein